MEENKKERALMDIDEFEKYVEYNRKPTYFQAVDKFKSIRRAMKRGLVTPIGIIAPKRPFNNRGNTSTRKGVHSRVMNEEKKQIYGVLTGRI